MSNPKQLPLFADSLDTVEEHAYSQANLKAELGTFKDNLRAPIHSWFRYPAGYSYNFVQHFFDKYDLRIGDWVYDPFSGSGTTLICAKQQGINAYGVEAHSFVHWVAQVKLYWEFPLDELYEQITHLTTQSQAFVMQNLQSTNLENVFPALVYKCYHPQDLAALYLLREFLLRNVDEGHVTDFLKLALTDTLRSAAAAGTGWPYIAPRKNRGEAPPKGALVLFQKTVWKMYNDLLAVSGYNSPSQIHNIVGDSRERQTLNNHQIKLALTSPPYLNNYDYADRTRLETYFWGLANSWSDITRQYRDKLIVAATTQIVRNRYEVATALNTEIKTLSSPVYTFLQNAICELEQRRLKKGGKKDYDLMVALYFNDILRVMQETYRVLMPGGRFCLVLGDSAPYGVHIETERLIGELGLALGFQHLDYLELRQRGKKWKNNPQRHDVGLREGIVILTK